MKKIIFILCILGTLNCSAQKVNLIKDSTSSYIYCNINTIYPKIGSKDSANKLTVKTFDDNQFDYTSIYYQLKDNNGNIVIDGNLQMQGDDYKEWISPSYLYNFVANKLSLNINND